MSKSSEPKDDFVIEEKSTVFVQETAKDVSSQLVIKDSSTEVVIEPAPSEKLIVEDFERVRFRRISYEAEATAAKIHAIPDLDNFLGDRLLQGR